MTPYTHYKNTHIAWLGEIPSHWEILPIRSIFCFRNEKNNPIKTENILSLSIANGVTQYSEENRGGNKRKDDLTAYKLAYENDIVLNSMNVVVGAVGRSKYFGAISPVYYALYLHNNDDIRFYEYIFSNNSFQRSLLKYGKGILIKVSDNGKLNTIRMKISQDDLKTIIFPKPPLPEQTAIADFLDEKTAQIKEAIALKSEQIDKLKEYRQTLINQTVTQGLNPTVPMKNSGVEWLGEVPEHWEILALKRVARINPSIGIKNKLSDEKVCFLPMEKVLVNGQIIDDVFLPIKDVSSGFTAFAKNDIIVAKITPCFENGKSAFLDKLPTEFGYGSTEFHVLRPSNRILGRFLYLIIHSKLFLDNGEAMMIGSAGQKRVPTDFIANYKIALPPLSEQTAIADFLDDKTAQIDTAIEQYQAEIGKLKEYQQSLVNEVVTGKVRVE